MKVVTWDEFYDAKPLHSLNEFLIDRIFWKITQEDGKYRIFESSAEVCDVVEKIDECDLRIMVEDLLIQLYKIRE